VETLEYCYVDAFSKEETWDKAEKENNYEEIFDAEFVDSTVELVEDKPND
jgi:hypothetical protein